jgi:hypothetical protein
VGKLGSFCAVQFNVYLCHQQGNWKVMALLCFKNLWDCRNFTWLILIHYPDSNLLAVVSENFYHTLPDRWHLHVHML